MKRLKVIMSMTLAATSVAVAIAVWNLLSLYQSEKRSTMETLRECAENAVLLEMIGRMKRSEEATESFIRLNFFLEVTQQKDGRVAQSDTIRTSLASILKTGLDFSEGKEQPDPSALDSIFIVELNRHGLYPDFASIDINQNVNQSHKPLWKTTYRISPTSKSYYEIYVSPMNRNVLSGMWGIIVPFFVVILLFSFLTVYLSRTVNRLRTLEQMKDDFTHNMTHELKTPIAVAYSAADSMLRYYDQSDEARNRHFLKIIMQRLSFLSGMIENILSMSMERFKTMELNIERVSLKPIIEEVAGMMELKATKPVKIDIEVPDSLCVTADPLHLGNVISNLMDNALKYSGESVDINVKADERSITVTDNGIGIDRESLPYIFDKFYRVPVGDRYEAGGYGLGLYYVRQIVELHGWNIEVTSKPGYGTKFTIKFNGNEKG